MAWLPSLRISQKLPLALVGSAIVVSAGVGIASYLLASQTIESEARQNLETIAVERANQLSAKLQSIETDLVKTGNTDATVKALAAFNLSWQQAVTNNALDELKKTYTTDNPNPPEQRLLLDTAATTLSYGTWHAKFQPVFRGLIQASGYADLYLFDVAGNLVYSADKRDDFATSFAAGGPFAGSALGTAYANAMKIDTPTDFVFADFSAYPANPTAPLAFLAKPVFDAQSHKIGVVAIAIGTQAIDQIIGTRTGLGDSGDVFMVGLDGLARSDSAKTADNDVLKPALFDDTIKQAVTGVPGDTALNSNGVDMLVSAVPVDVTATQSWALVAIKSTAEIFAPVTRLALTMTAVGAVLLLIVAILGWLFSRSITAPLSRLTDGMGELAEGNLDVEIAGRGKRDEIGDIAKALEVFRASARQVQNLTDGERVAIAQRRDERAAMMADLQREFGAVVDAAVHGDFSARVEAQFADAELNALADSVNSLVETVERGVSETGSVLSAFAEADLSKRMEGAFDGALAQLKADTNAVGDRLLSVMGQLRGTSRTLKSATREILSGANDLGERTTRQAATIEETSAAMEQLASTVVTNAARAQEASSNAAVVTDTAEAGGKVMVAANEAMQRISASSSKIGNIIGLIDDIAFQTNLLALNASVEAARAGEAGKGFAVVAVEVRRLAQSAAQASAEVKVLIQQSGSEVAGGSRLVAEAAGKLDAMLAAARKNHDLLVGIAQASHEQASAIEEVTVAVRTLDEMTQHNAALVEETNAALEKTEGQAVELDRLVDQFHLGDEAESRPAVRTPAPVYSSQGSAALKAEWAEF